VAAKVNRVTISLAPDLLERAEKRRNDLKYKSFSEYVAFLIAADVLGRQTHTVIRGEGATSYQFQSQAPRGLLNEDPPG
jgi:hypothetical protein